MQFSFLSFSLASRGFVSQSGNRGGDGKWAEIVVGKRGKGGVVPVDPVNL